MFYFQLKNNNFPHETRLNVIMQDIIFSRAQRQPLNKHFGHATEIGFHLCMFNICLFIFRFGLLELNHSKGIDDLGRIKWDIALCLLLVYLICYFSLWKGISTSGKVTMPELRANFQLILCINTGGLVYGTVPVRRAGYFASSWHHFAGFSRRHSLLPVTKLRSPEES